MKPTSRLPLRLRLVPERLVAGGDALARHESGKVVFVAGALPGEEVEAEVVEQRRDFARARLVRVLDPSLDRVEPPCPHVGRGCGGCTWQHMTVSAQRGARVELVRDALRRIARQPDAVVDHAETLAATPDTGITAGRTTIRVGVDLEGRLGFRARRSNDVVALDSCLVSHPALAELLATVRLPGASEAVLRYSVSTGERLVWWWGPDDGGPDGRGLDGEDPVRPRGIPDDVLLGEGAQIHEAVAGHRLQVTASSFFQPSPWAAEALVEAVAYAAGPLSGRVLVDAYGGVGLFSCTLGPQADHVVLVEEHAAAVADARANLAASLPEGSYEVVASRVEDLAVRAVPKVAPLVVVADPARSGLGPRAADALGRLGAQRFVLVSCDAASLARDTVLLEQHGYRHAGSVVLDQFPHTHHVEVVTRFDRLSWGRSSGPST